MSPTEEESLRLVSERELKKIIETRKPRGLFYSDDGNFIVGVDNRTGDAWTEEFDSLADCIEWLKGEE